MRNKTKRILLLILPLLALGNQLLARADEGANSGADLYFYDRLFSNGMIVVTAIIIIAAFSALLRLLNIMVRAQQIKIYHEAGLDAYLEETKKVEKESWWSRMYRKMIDVVPIEQEQDVMLDHNYDGIRELDNSLPPWWVAMFYMTIAFAVIYMGYYHFTDNALSSTEEYALEMEQAEAGVKAFLATQASQVDETNAELLTDEQSLASGKVIYDVNCAACHGMLGEGGVGPNMTDDYWIHGGDIKNVFKTVKYGVPEKGMIAWKAQLKSADIHQVSSYILSLVGTNPPNGKEPEGELYQQKEEMQPADSDSTGVIGQLEADQ